MLSNSGVLRLHWSPKSPFVRKVMVAAHELGLADRIECIRTVASMKDLNPILLRDNPLGKIPALVLSDGRVLFDSFVIIDFLQNLAGRADLIPDDADLRSRTLVRHALANGLLDLFILWRNERDKPVERQTPEWLSGFATKAKSGLDDLEAQAPDLSDQPFDIGHLTIGCCLDYIDFRFQDLDWRAGRPELTKFQARFRARPSAIATEIGDG